MPITSFLSIISVWINPSFQVKGVWSFQVCEERNGPENLEWLRKMESTKIFVIYTKQTYWKVIKWLVTLVISWCTFTIWMLERMEWMEIKKHWEKNNWFHLNERTFDFFKKLTIKSKKKRQNDSFHRNGWPVSNLFLRDSNLCSRHQEKCKYLLSDCLNKI